MLYIVTIEVAPAAEAQWWPWYRQHHVPDVLREPGMLEATIFRDDAHSPDGWLRFVCHYEVESRAAFDQYTHGEAARRLRQDYADRFGSTTRLSRQVLVEEASLKRA